MSCTCETSCGCCAGTSVITPEPIYNRPGLGQIAYRIGEHGSFLESMLARLSSTDFPALTGLTARTTDDPAIALLDAWASVSDVLTFYQERIANEGYLRTATERRSVLELARLIGYAPRPGVAASVYLAYTVDANATEPIELPAGARAQSIPGPGELPQSFEIGEPFVARKEWNEIKPRTRRPQTRASIMEGSDERPGSAVYLKGTNLLLKINDALLIAFTAASPEAFRVTEVEENAKDDYTYVRFSSWLPTGTPISVVTQLRRELVRVEAALLGLSDPESPSRGVLSAWHEFVVWFYEQSIASVSDSDVSQFLVDPDAVARLIAAFDPVRETVLRASAEPELAEVAEAFASGIESLLKQLELDENEVVVRALAAATEIRAATRFVPGGTVMSQQDQRLVALTHAVLGKLAAPPSVGPRNSQSLVRSATSLFDARSDVGARLVGALRPALASALAEATRNLQATPTQPIRVFALRQKTLLFGATAPKKVESISERGMAKLGEWTATDMAAETGDAIHLDAVYDKLKPDSYVMLDFSGLRGAKLSPYKLVSNPLIARAGEVDAKIARAEYNLSGQTTRLELRAEDRSPAVWFTRPKAVASNDETNPFALIRKTAVYFDSQELTLADEVITTPICGGDDWIEIDSLVTGLESGRWLVLSGERADIEGTSGVRAGELVMLEAVRQYVATTTEVAAVRTSDEPATERFLPGDKLHTYLKLASPLQYCYKRDTAAINANVVKATHGETRSEVMGAGDSSKALQTFALRQPPLTFVASPIPAGAASTLHVYVNNVEWHEAESLIELAPNQRGFVTTTQDDGATLVTFGNGVTGARVPTGLENVKAIYRNGIGRAGNVKPGQISQLMTRPLGIKAVTNPLSAAGGADRESRDQARRNAPLAVQSLDRLISTEDYADFARTFAGVGKALSARLEVDGAECVFVTIAGVDDNAIDKTSDLYANLLTALRDHGDAYQPFRVEPRELLLLVTSARIAIDPDYRWEEVADRVRTGLLDSFSFERRELGQGVALSALIASIQSIRGVVWVDVDAFGAVSQTAADGSLRAPQELAAEANAIFAGAAERGRPGSAVVVRGIHRPKGTTTVRPAQVAFFVPSVPETILLTRVGA